MGRLTSGIQTIGNKQKNKNNSHLLFKPYMLFLFVGSQLCTPASFRPGLATAPLPSAGTSANASFNINRIFVQGTFTPLVQARAGRTTKSLQPSAFSGG